MACGKKPAIWRLSLYAKGKSILEEGGVTTDFRSVWLLVFWGRLTVGGMILTPMTSHHMMHLPTAIDRIVEKES